MPLAPNITKSNICFARSRSVRRCAALRLNSVNNQKLIALGIAILAALISLFIVSDANAGQLRNEQTESESPTQLPTENRAERRLREEISKKRTFLTGYHTSNSSSRFDQRIKQQIEDRRNAAAKPMEIESPDSGSREPPSQFNEGLIQPAENVQSSDRPSDAPWRMGTQEPFGSTNENRAGDLLSRNAIQETSSLTTLDELEQLAIENHPTLNAAVARILTARHEALQAGLAPNPQLGLFIDEMGNENDPGIWGAYLQRNVIRGNKLALGRRIKNREANALEVQFESQVLRIKTDVRTAFYKLLITQKKYELAVQLYQSQQNAVRKSTDLFEAGETPKTDLLQTELQTQRTAVLLSQASVTQKNAWRELASVVGHPELPARQIVGSLAPIAEKYLFEECLEQIFANSPEIQSANAEMIRVQATIDRELAETIPNYQTQLTLGRDSTSNHFFTGLQVQVPLQICNKNQGNIAAAKSRLTVAQHEVERIKLSLAKRLSTEYQKYESALVKSEMYAENLLPKAQQTLELLSSGYPDEVSFLQLVTAQQSVIDITMEYLDSLNQVWESRLKIEGLLLSDSLNP